MAAFMTNIQIVRENNVIISVIGSAHLGSSQPKKINGSRKL